MGEATEEKKAEQPEETQEMKEEELDMDFLKGERITTEQTVIDEDLVIEAVKTERQSFEDVNDQTAKDEKEQEIELTSIKTLMLSFKNIYQIDNLLGYDALTKLQLDNNKISKIENLGHLKNLRWLDLSFNEIECVEGLDDLVNLEDLSLFRNKITELHPGLQNLKNLEILSVGENDIDDLDQIKRLRLFKKLRIVNFAGNPVAKADDYQLKFLDYKLIQPTAQQKAFFPVDKLEEIEKEEREIKATLDKKLQKKREAAEDAKAFLLGFPTLFDDMFNEDKEANIFKKLPDFGALQKRYRTSFEEVLGVFITQCRADKDERDMERTRFDKAVAKAQAATRQKSVNVVQAFEAKKKFLLKAYDSEQDEKSLEGVLLAVEHLQNDLMEIEMLFVEQLSKVIGAYDYQMREAVKASTRKRNGCAADLQAVVENYQEELTKLVRIKREQYLNDELQTAGNSRDEKEIGDFLGDSEKCKASVTSSYEAHNGKIQALVDILSSKENRMYEKEIEKIREMEFMLNRARVSEIFDLVARYKDLITYTTEAATGDNDDNDG